MEHINVINFSGGRTSAYMTKRLLEETDEKYLITFQNTGRESKETLDFINQCDKKWNLNILWLEYRKPSVNENRFEVVTYETASRNGEPFMQLIEQRPASIPNIQFRYCTTQLKIKTLKRYLKKQGVKDYTSFNGIRYDEPKRWSKAKDSDFDVDLPLVKWKVTKEDVREFWNQQEFDLKLEQPFGNCDGCFLKGKGKLLEILSKDINALDWWIEIEETNIKKVQFKKEITYRQLKELAIKGENKFSDDPSFNCFCNAD
jgi:3'-phosphoadenosine 5'-phosphosulfate sulfotransferase (PAPS reductase)/FAD synthetase